ncbi:MAG: hydantoinase/oxoprolinase family protein [Candidatus Binataceae bacterium]
MRVAFDIGGTFTDVIALGRDKRIHTAKVLSLLDRVGEDIVVCIKGLQSSEPVENFVHATTMASNAVIERKTAPTGLITTKGFRDVLEMMNQKAPAIENINWERLPPLVPRRLRLEVAERILADGTIEHRLDRAQAREAIAALLAAKVEAIAICLINAYLNPVHEQELGRMVREAAPRTTVCLSSQVHPECREYERTSTTVINASLVPVVNRYLDQLEKHLAPYSRRLLIMQSNGGTMTSEMARQRPMYMVESGPAAGVLAAARMAGELGLGSVLSFDMGGTTAKACLIQNGQPLEKAGGEVGGGVAAVQIRGTGHALRAPTLDIVEVGAGGGSIAWIDDAGALRAGPMSAGADPGPACYARGGTKATVTDANVVLGYMNPETIADGTLRIDRQAAVDAIEKHVAGPLGLPLMAAASGIVEVANASMMRALRAVSTERGHDMREMTLVAFGGAGPIHAAALCESVGISRVAIPPYPGLFSALGLLLANSRLDYIRSVERQLGELAASEVMGIYRELERQARQEFAAQGIPSEDMVFERSVDLRVGFMRDEIALPFPDQAANDLGALERDFREAHRREFGFEGEGDLNLVNLRLRAKSASGHLSFSDVVAAAGAMRSSPRANGPWMRQAYFGRKHGSVDTEVVMRDAISGRRPGPIIIEEPDTTVAVPPGWSVERDRLNILVLTRNV